MLLNYEALQKWDLLVKMWDLIVLIPDHCLSIYICTTIHRYPIFSKRYSVMCKVYTGYCGTSEIEHGLCACTVDNPSLKLGDYLSVQAHKPCFISHLYSLRKYYVPAGANSFVLND